MFFRQIGEMMIETNFLVGVLIGAILFVVFKVMGNGAFNLIKGAKKFSSDVISKRKSEIESLFNRRMITEQEALEKKKNLEKMTNYYSKKERQIRWIQKLAIPLMALFVFGLIVKLTSTEFVQNIYFWLIDNSGTMVGISTLGVVILTLVTIFIAIRTYKTFQKNN